MPIERREIILSHEELLQAVQAYAKMTSTFLPRGQIIEACIGPGADGGAELTVVVDAIYGQSQQRIEVRAGAPDVLELLIRCCLENNIPIPRRGVRGMRVVEGMLALVIEIGDSAAEPAPVRPARPEVVRRPQVVRG